MDSAMEMAKRLCDRLDEKGFDFDEDTLLDEVRHGMSQPENQGKQDAIFSSAIEAALER